MVSLHREISDKFKRLENYVKVWVGFEELQTEGSGGERRVFPREHKQGLRRMEKHGAHVEGSGNRGCPREGARDRK